MQLTGAQYDDPGCKFESDHIRHPPVAVSCLAQNSPTATPGKQPDPGFTIFVTASTTPYKLGEPVQVTITLTNNTNHEIGWSAERVKEPQYMACRYDLERNGHEVETTSFTAKSQDETGSAIRMRYTEAVPSCF